jgi:hypothetical protein
VGEVKPREMDRQAVPMDGRYNAGKMTVPNKLITGSTWL